jgi:two-component system NtrC family sensor kinase
LTTPERVEATVDAKSDEAALQRELQELRRQQRATGEVLKIINRSSSDLQAALDVLVGSAARLCEADLAGILQPKGKFFQYAANYGYTPEFQKFMEEHPLKMGRGTVVGRTLLEGRPIHIPDVTQDPEYRFLDAQRVGHFRTILGVPLLHEEAPVGVIVLMRTRMQPFDDRQIDVARAFADQAVIVLENARLIIQTRAARDAAEAALAELKSAQAKLIHAEKMASLGQLTAGIAHEIKNPLNFINNFAGLSGELLDELKDLAAPALATLDAKTRAAVDETLTLLAGNLAKIVEHGRRADGIVKSMLSHSRGGTGDWQSVDLNALVDETLNLAYHGARAQDKEFNITLVRDFEPTGRPIDVVPQDITRVFLNLFGNAFYAANKRRRDGGDVAFRPRLDVVTRDIGEAVEVKVRDNGTGIPPEVRARLFQPFFTTKPTGEGTGLGLSISYDIVTELHGGAIEVESEPGAFTEFTVRLPRRSRAAASSGGKT